MRSIRFKSQARESFEVCGRSGSAPDASTPHGLRLFFLLSCGTCGGVRGGLGVGFGGCRGGFASFGSFGDWDVLEVSDWEDSEGTPLDSVALSL